jgi:hypothetical protein
VAACQGSEGDATPFTDVKVDDVSEELHKRGYQRYGWEVSRPLQCWVAHISLHVFTCCLLLHKRG